MKLKNKETGELYDVVSGFILTQDVAKATDVNGSFLSIRKEGDTEDILYMWKYWADNDFDIVESAPVEVLSETTATDEDVVH